MMSLRTLSTGYETSFQLLWDFYFEKLQRDLLICLIFTVIEPQLHAIDPIYSHRPRFTASLNVYTENKELQRSQAGAQHSTQLIPLYTYIIRLSSLKPGFYASSTWSLEWNDLSRYGERSLSYSFIIFDKNSNVFLAFSFHVFDAGWFRWRCRTWGIPVCIAMFAMCACLTG